MKKVSALGEQPERWFAQRKGVGEEDGLREGRDQRLFVEVLGAVAETLFDGEGHLHFHCSVFALLLLLCFIASSLFVID